MKALLSKLGITDKPTFIAFIKQFIKFGLVGLSNTIISLVIYYLLVYFGLNYILANTIAFVISVLNAYFWNSRYVFVNPTNRKLKSLIKVFASYAITFIFSTVFLYLMVDMLGVSKFIAPLINLCITIPINFLLNKFWAFK